MTDRRELQAGDTGFWSDGGAHCILKSDGSLWKQVCRKYPMTFKSGRGCRIEWTAVEFVTTHAYGLAPVAYHLVKGNR